MIGTELNAFGDASENADGACLYLRLPQPDGKFSVSFIMTGAALCARLIAYVTSALHIEVVYLTDRFHSYAVLNKGRTTQVEKLCEEQSPEYTGINSTQ